MNVHVLAFYKNERALSDSKPALRVIGSSTLKRVPAISKPIPHFPVWKRNPNLARVAEVVGSILCSSYWCLQLGCHRPQPIDPDTDFRTTMSCGGITVV